MVLVWSKRARQMIEMWGTYIKILGFPRMMFQFNFCSNQSVSSKTALHLLLWQAYHWVNLNFFRCSGPLYALYLYSSKSHKNKIRQMFIYGRTRHQEPDSIVQSLLFRQSTYSVLIVQNKRYPLSPLLSHCSKNELLFLQDNHTNCLYWILLFPTREGFWSQKYRSCSQIT